MRPSRTEMILVMALFWVVVVVVPLLLLLVLLSTGSPWVVTGVILGLAMYLASFERNFR